MNEATRFLPVIELIEGISSIEGEMSPDDSIHALRKFYSYLKSNPPLVDLAILEDCILIYLDESNHSLSYPLVISLAEYLEVNKEQIILDLKTMPSVDRELSLEFLLNIGGTCQTSLELAGEILTRSVELISLTFPPDENPTYLANWMKAYFMILAPVMPFDPQLRNTIEKDCREIFLKLREEHLENKDSTLIGEAFILFKSGTIDDYVLQNFFSYLVTPKIGYDQLITVKECQCLFDAWKTSSSEAGLVANVSEQLRVMIELEELQPGSTSELRVLYGIRSFARYDPEVLIAQLSYTETGVSSVFLINTLSDHSDTFLNWKDTHSILAMQVSEHQSQLIVIEAGSVKEIAERIQFFADGNEPYIQSIMISSHGNYQGLSLNINYQEDNSELWNSQLRIGREAGDLFRQIGSYIYDGGEIALLACEAGQGELPPAKLISNLIPHAYISAFRYKDGAEIITYQGDYFQYESAYYKRNGLVVYYHGQLLNPE